MIYLLNEIDISDRKFHEKNENATFPKLLMKNILCFCTNLNEEHFMLFCTKFKDLRSDFFEK